MRFSSLVFITLLCFSFGQYLPYQSHSFNDVDYLIQQVVKGVDSIKIDVYAVGKQSCAQYSTWKEKDNRCDANGKHPICCLALRGDTSSGPILNDYFNTTTDLVNAFNNSKYDFIWKRDKRIARYTRPIYIAMNIQFQAITGGVTKNWLASMIKTIRDRNLDIYLMLGREKVLQYYGELCDNKSKLCDADAKIIADYPFILQGEFQEEHPRKYGKLINFNIPFPDLGSFCKTKFPSYGETLPFYFYEIAHELDVQNIVNTWLSPKCNRPKSHNDLDSVRITSNVDPEMMQAYLPSKNPFEKLTTAKNPLIDTLETDKSVIVSFYDEVKKVTIVQIRSLENPDTLTVISEQEIKAGPYTKMSYNAPNILLSNNEVAHVYLLKESKPLNLQLQHEISQPGLDIDIAVSNNEIYAVQINKQGKCGAQALSITITNLNTKNVVINQCTNSISAFNLNHILSSSLSVAFESGQTLRGILFISAKYSRFNQDKQALYAISFATSLSALNLMNSISVVLPRSYIDFGVTPSVKLINENGKLFVLEAHSDGICQCGNIFNNGNSFKCGISRTDSHHRALQQNMKYMLNYNWGRLDDFSQRIKEGRYVDACDSQIMHAKYYNGEIPSGIVFRNKKAGSLQALFLNQYVDYSKLPMMTRLVCGATRPVYGSQPKSSVIGKMFNILDYSLFEYL